MSSDSGVSLDTVEPVFLPVEQPQPLAYTTEPIAEVTTTTPTVETSSANAEPVTKTSTTKKVVSTVLTALGAGALLGI